MLVGVVGFLVSEVVLSPVVSGCLPSCGGWGVVGVAASTTNTFRNQNHWFQSKFAYCKLFGVYAGEIPLPFPALQKADLCSLHGLALVLQARDIFLYFFLVFSVLYKFRCRTCCECLGQPQHPKTGQQSGNHEPRLISRPHQNIPKRLRPPPVTGSNPPLLPTVDIFKFHK